MKIILLLSLFIVLNTFCIGQKIHSFLSPMGSLASARNNGFTSNDAGFSIDLPREIGGFSGVTGIEYNWRLNEGYFVAGIVDKDSDIENSADFETETLKIIDATFNSIARDLFATKFEIVNLEKKNITFQDHKGIEARIALTDTLCLIRVFWVKNRAYKVGVLLTKEQQKFESAAQKVFYSLKIAKKENVEATTRKRIEENTPQPLPQMPVVRRPKSDAEEDNLKGKVKMIIKESKYLKGAKAGSPAQRDVENYFNEAGNLTKSVFYDDTSGMPFQITVYGYLDGNRVSNSNFVEDDVSPPLMAIQESPSAGKRRDPRYDSKYVFKYDAAGKLIEKINYDNAGSIRTRLVYGRKDNVIKETLYDEKGKVNTISHTRIDEKGNPLEDVYFASPVPGWNSVYVYKYEEFDKEGNWTKRTMTKSRTFQGTTREEWTTIENRTITYY